MTYARTIDLIDEAEALRRLLLELPSTAWDRPTAAVGWTIRDQVAHLADTEEVAYDTLTDGPRHFARAVVGHSTPEDFTASGCRRGAGLSPEELVPWWHCAHLATAGQLAELPGATRVAWGLGMTVPSFITARLMEHWAHGLDIRDALNVPVPETERMVAVAALGLDTLRYALRKARRPWPQGRTLRLQLTTHDGSPVELGPPEASDVVSGNLTAWCRVATQRAGPDYRAQLTACGPLAAESIQHARAYL